jgi:hypothetical protein
MSQTMEAAPPRTDEHDEAMQVLDDKTMSSSAPGSEAQAAAPEELPLYLTMPWHRKMATYVVLCVMTLALTYSSTAYVSLACAASREVRQLRLWHRLRQYTSSRSTTRSGLSVRVPPSSALC